MEKKKIYVFFTAAIIPIGGMQMYTAGKAKYLEKLGWKVYIFVPESKYNVPIIPTVDKYLKIGGNCNFLGILHTNLKLSSKNIF